MFIKLFLVVSVNANWGVRVIFVRSINAKLCTAKAETKSNFMTSASVSVTKDILVHIVNLKTAQVITAQIMVLAFLGQTDQLATVHLVGAGLFASHTILVEHVNASMEVTAY